MPSKPVVLIVEDNDMLRKLISVELAQDGRFQVEDAATGEEGLQKAVSTNCAVVVLDMMLGDTDGLQFIDKLREVRKDPPSIIAMTAAAASMLPDSIIEAPYRGLVSAVFRKPFDHEKLRETVAFCAGV